MTADAERSAAVLQAAGFRVATLTDLAPWQLLAVTSQGLTLVAAVEAAWPPDLGVAYGPPPGWPPGIRRLLHAWTAAKPVPLVLSL